MRFFPWVRVEAAGRLVRGPAVARGTLIEFAKTFPRTVKDAVELKSGQAQSGADLFLIVLCEIEPNQELAITIVAHFRKKPTDASVVFHLQNAIKGASERIRHDRAGFGIGQRRIGCAPPEVIDGKVARQTANESGKPFRFAHVSGTDFLEGSEKHLLVEIVEGTGFGGQAPQNHQNAAAVTGHQLVFGGDLSRADAGDECRRAEIVRR